MTVRETLVAEAEAARLKWRHAEIRGTSDHQRLYAAYLAACDAVTVHDRTTLQETDR